MFQKISYLRQNHIKTHDRKNDSLCGGGPQCERVHVLGGFHILRRCSLHGVLDQRVLQKANTLGWMLPRKSTAVPTPTGPSHTVRQTTNDGNM